MSQLQKSLHKKRHHTDVYSMEAERVLTVYQKVHDKLPSFVRRIAELLMHFWHRGNAARMDQDDNIHNRPSFIGDRTQCSHRRTLVGLSLIANAKPST